MTTEIGFIGAGNMGGPMVKNLLAADYSVVVYDNSQTAIDACVAAGATAVGSPKELADTVETVLVCLPTPDIVRAVALGEDGLVHGGKIKTYIDLSTTGPRMAIPIAEAMEEAGIIALDAPVSGGIAARRDGNLSIMAGGEADVLARAMPVLQTFGSRIFHAGPSGSGATVKLVNNLLAGINMVATMEAMVLGVKAGLTVETLKEVVSASSGNSGIFQSLVDTVMQQSPNPPNGQVANQGLHTIGKDVQLAVDLARRHAVPLPLGSPASQVFLSGMARGWADREYWSIIQIFEEMSAVRVRPADF